VGGLYAWGASPNVLKFHRCKELWRSSTEIITQHPRKCEQILIRRSQEKLAHKIPEHTYLHLSTFLDTRENAVVICRYLEKKLES